MKGIFAFIMLLSIVFLIPSNKIVSFDYWLELAETMGDVDVPTLTGGHNFSDGFQEGVGASVYIISYPVRWAFFAINQIGIVIRWVGGSI